MAGGGSWGTPRAEQRLRALRGHSLTLGCCTEAAEQGASWEGDKQPVLLQCLIPGREGLYREGQEQVSGRELVGG